MADLVNYIEANESVNAREMGQLERHGGETDERSKDSHRQPVLMVAPRAVVCVCYFVVASVRN